jgi:hypothetical protein
MNSRNAVRRKTRAEKTQQNRCTSTQELVFGENHAETGGFQHAHGITRGAGQ